MSDFKPKVLVLDDDISVRESLRLLIESAGWQAETFGSGEEFLARPRVLAPSCLVLDAGLPDISGFELLTVLLRSKVSPVLFGSVLFCPF